MKHKMLHNAPSLDLSSNILFWKKSRKIDNVNWIDIELIWNLIFPPKNPKKPSFKLKPKHPKIFVFEKTGPKPYWDYFVS